MGDRKYHSIELELPNLGEPNHEHVANSNCSRNRFRTIVAGLMLCSALFSINGSAAQAQDKPGPCPEGQVIDDATGTCVEPLPTEEESAEPEASGSLTVSTYICDSDFDTASATTDDYFNLCGFPGEGIGFTVAEADDTGASGTTNSNGYAGFDDLNLGAVSVTQTVPNGYSAPFVACAAGDGNTDYIPTPVYNGSSIDLDLAAASYYVCVWFNTSMPSAGPVASIGITAWSCPNGFVPATGDQNEFFDNCQVNRLPGVEFQLLGSDGSAVGVGTTDSSGRLGFGDLLPDTYTVAETFPPDTNRPQPSVPIPMLREPATSFSKPKRLPMVLSSMS